MPLTESLRPIPGITPDSRLLAFMISLTSVHCTCTLNTEWRRTLEFRIDPESGVPVVRQIVDSLRILLVEGHLVPGTMLPSVRRVAVELGVHFNTVAEAYRQLASEGWLDLKHGRGARGFAACRPRPHRGGPEQQLFVTDCAGWLHRCGPKAFPPLISPRSCVPLRRW